MSQRPESGPLDLHEGISDAGARKAPSRLADPALRSCKRWPEKLRLRSSAGEVVRGRCRSTNLCPYCARLFAVETSELLALDALGGSAPGLWAVLTTRTATMDVARFYDSRRQVQRAVRRRWPGAEFAWVLEFTTGYGPRSGGKRRPHWNALVKGVPTAAVDELRAVVVGVWCAREDAQPAGQYVGQVAHVGGLMRYLALHFLKPGQSPPEGFRGHRFTSTRGYFGEPVPVARGAAREALALKRAMWRLSERGCPDDLVLELAERDREVARGLTWELTVVTLADLRAEAEALAARAAGQVEAAPEAEEGVIIHA
jgi:hypothetical protein